MIRRLCVAGATVALLLAGIAPSMAIGPAGLAAPMREQVAHIKVARPTLAPFGFVSYCVRNADDCQELSGPGSVKWTHALLRELRRVNYKVNRSLRPRNEAAGKDQWRADVGSGDCEDYVLTKRRELIRRGFPVNAMRIAVVKTPNNVGHAVLVVSTSRGDIVLDNRTNSIVNWYETDLSWVMIQSGGNPLFWSEVDTSEDRGA